MQTLVDTNIHTTISVGDLPWEDIAACRAVQNAADLFFSEDIGDIAAAKRTWEHALAMLGDASYDLVVLDELTYMLAFDYLPEDEVISALTGRPESQSVVVTGRGGGQALREAMDTVSEVKEIKHAYRAGIRARQGVDY